MSTNRVLLLNQAMSQLVKDKEYNDKGLNDLRTVLAIQAMQSVSDLGKKKETKESALPSAQAVAARMGAVPPVQSEPSANGESTALDEAKGKYKKDPKNKAKMDALVKASNTYTEVVQEMFRLNLAMAFSRL